MDNKTQQQQLEEERNKVNPGTIEEQEKKRAEKHSVWEDNVTLLAQLTKELKVHISRAKEIKKTIQSIRKL